MIHSLQFPNNQSKREHFALSFNPKDTWVIVADLESKKELQNLILEKEGLILGPLVWRASELWAWVLQKLRPDLMVISHSAVFVMIREFLDEEDNANNIEISECYSGIQQMLPLFLHPEEQQIMSSWFEKRPEAKIRWGQNYTIIKKVWERFIKNKMLASSWVGGVLLFEQDFHEFFPEKVVLDLRYELDQVEAELFERVGRFRDLEVVTPECKNEDEQFRPYDLLLQTIKEKNESPFVGELTNYSTFEYESSLGEVRGAVSAVRSWLDSGVGISDIGIVVSELEVYWPILRRYLDAEGVVYNKGVVQKWQQFEGFTAWLAAMKLEIAQGTSTDLCQSLFNSVDQPQLSISKFNKFYTNISDISTFDPLSLNTKKSEPIKNSISKIDFIEWAQSLIPKFLSTKVLDAAIGHILQDMPDSYKMLLENWIEYLELSASRREVKIEADLQGAMSVVALTGSSWKKFSYIVVMGCSESQLKIVRKSVFPTDDLMSLSASYGFPVEAREGLNISRYISALSGGDTKEVYLSYAKMDFLGAPQGASLYWLANQKQKIGDSGVTTVWQAGNVEADKQITSHILKDTGKAEFGSIKTDKLISLSPTTLEQYQKCPAKVMFKKVFSLKEKNFLDLEMDPMSRGSMYHKICERIVEFDLSLNGLSKKEFIEKCIEEVEWTIMEKKLWPSQSQRYEMFIDRFIHFERQWRATYPESRAQGIEVSFEVFFNPKSLEFKDKESEGSFRIRGKIDRIDVDTSGNMLVVDYKSSVAAINSPGKWLEGGNTQLLLYSVLLESGLIAGFNGKVQAAQYYSLRDFNRSNGFFVAGKADKLCKPLSSRSSGLWTEEKKVDNFQVLVSQLGGICNQLEKGNYPPKPLKLSECDRCEWRTGCRAPHLI